MKRNKEVFEEYWYERQEGEYRYDRYQLQETCRCYANISEIGMVGQDSKAVEGADSPLEHLLEGYTH